MPSGASTSFAAPTRRVSGNLSSGSDPEVFDFGKENNRSDGTDIVDFGNDVLTGANVGKRYTHVSVSQYTYYQDEPLSPVNHTALAARQRLYRNGGDGWSLAVLVKSCDMMQLL